LGIEVSGAINREPEPHIAKRNNVRAMAAKLQSSINRVQSVSRSLWREQQILIQMLGVAVHSSGGTDTEPTDHEELDRKYHMLKSSLSGVSELKDNSFGTVAESCADTLENASRASEVCKIAIRTVESQIDALAGILDGLEHDFDEIHFIEVERPDLSALRKRLVNKKSRIPYTKIHTRIKPAIILRLLK
jgi:hypothetical protein